MAKADFKNSNFVVDENATIEESMKAITANRKGAAIVINSENRVVGVLSDGDIRRALVKGSSMLTPVYKAMNSNVKTITSEDKEILANPRKFFDENRHIHLLPVVDKEGKLIDLLVLELS